MKVLVATEKPFAKVAIDGIRKEIEAAGYELALLEKYTEKQQLLDAVKDANAVIIRSDIIDKEVLDAAKELKIVVRAGAGYDNVDLEAATAHGVCVMNTPGQNSNAVAELAFGMMIMAVRNFYDGKSGTELMGKKLGIHACRCRGVVEPECFFLQRVKVIGQEHRAVIHFQLPFAVRLEIAYLIGGRLVIAATHQLAAYFGGFTNFQFLGYWQRFDAERVRLLNIQAVITGGHKN